MDQIKFLRKKDKIVIEIPFDIIESAADGHPEITEKVRSKSLLSEDVMFELENNLGDTESGLTGFQELLDAAILAVYENGAESFEWED